MQRPGEKRKKKKKQRLVVQERKEKKRKEKKIKIKERGNVPSTKKKKKKRTSRGHFCLLSSLIFSSFWGENFLVGPRRKDLALPFIFLSFHPTKHTQKKISSHFLSKVFHPPYFTSKQTHP